MEKRFSVNQYISTPEKKILARELNLDPERIKVWFQNRRMKYKKWKTSMSTSTSPDKSEAGPSSSSCFLVPVSNSTASPVDSVATMGPSCNFFENIQVATSSEISWVRGYTWAYQNQAPPYQSFTQLRPLNHQTIVYNNNCGGNNTPIYTNAPVTRPSCCYSNQTAAPIFDYRQINGQLQNLNSQLPIYTSQSLQVQQQQQQQQLFQENYIINDENRSPHLNDLSFNQQHFQENLTNDEMNASFDWLVSTGYYRNNPPPPLRHI
ncbi:homeobox protein Hox-B3a-like [Centruroides sculpturatus]|uniref:homeobox protein Hox-B3a-like n=1 Tax=Centruroides sculpturatus TaxID=218467 RepID=UPI000C6E0019|nr:homeobox protein Hox-B3a-like [Centruroides sculpturatus]